MNKITLPCQVKAHKLDLDRRALEMQLKAVKDGFYTITIEPVSDNISHRQRKYFFGVVVRALQLGFTERGIPLKQQDIIDYLKDKFIFRETPNPLYGEMLKVPISLSNSDKGLTKPEFNAMKEQIQEFAATEWGIIIPDPNEKIFND